MAGDVSKLNFCEQCRAKSGFSIFTCSRRNNSQSCPYTLGESKVELSPGEAIKTLFGLAIFGTILTLILNFFGINWLLVLSIFSVIFLLVTILACSLTKTIGYELFSDSTGIKLKALRWKKADLPHEYILTPPNFLLDINLPQVNLKYPASIITVDDDYSKQYKEQTIAVFLNTFISLLAQGLINVSCTVTFMSKKENELQVKSQEYFLSSSENFAIGALEGRLEQSLLYHLQNTPQADCTVDNLIKKVYGKERLEPFKWLLNNLILGEVIKREKGDFSKCKGFYEFEFNRDYLQEIKIEKENIKELADELEQQSPDLVAYLKNQISRTVDTVKKTPGGRSKYERKWS